MRSIYLLLLVLGCAMIPAAMQAQTKEEQAALDLEHAGKTDEAIVAFGNLLKAGPGNTNIMNELAALYYDKGDYETSYKMAGDALKLDNGNPRFMISKGRAALELNKPDETISLMEQVIAKDPSIAYAQLLRGQALEAKDQTQQAIGAYSKALQADPEMVVAYKLRGSAFLNISRYEDALKDFNQFIRADQTSSSAYNMRGMIYARMHKAQEAIADYTKSIAINPANFYALNNRGLAYLESKQASAAKADFQKAIDANDKYAEGYYGMARVYNEEKAFDKALPMIKKAIELNPKMQPYLAVYCLTLIGLNREKDAITAADQLLAMNESNTDGWIYKATAQSNLKNYTGAITTLNAAIAKVPDNYLLYSLRAYVNKQQGNTAAASADDAKAKQLSSK